MRVSVAPVLENAILFGLAKTVFNLPSLSRFEWGSVRACEYINFGFFERFGRSCRCWKLCERRRWTLTIIQHTRMMI